MNNFLFYGLKDKQILRQTLYQALIIPIIKEEKLDLSDNEKYQI